MKTPFELGVCAQKSGCMSRLLMLSGRFCRTTDIWRTRLTACNLIVGPMSGAISHSPREEPERRVIGFIVAVIAQLMESGFEIRLMIAKLERRQHAAIIGSVAAIVEQRDVPVGP